MDTTSDEQMSEPFAEMLKGGHPNSLGRTIEVVDAVLSSPNRFEELFACYRSDDPTVRLRTSSAMKRVEKERHDLLVAYLDRFIEEIGALDQASAQWTLAQLFARLAEDMIPPQRAAALSIMKRNLSSHDDWIVLNTSMETLTDWARDDRALQQWLTPQLDRLTGDPRKSVANRARKKRAALGL